MYVPRNCLLVTRMYFKTQTAPKQQLLIDFNGN